MNALELSGRAILALSTGLPTMAFAMLDQPASPVTQRKERGCLRLAVQRGVGTSEPESHVHVPEERRGLLEVRRAPSGSPAR
jgi:hypothetical protein